jgi:predicted ATP-dependent Lon-type protease
MSVQGNVEGIDAVGEILLIARENGARTVSLPCLCEGDVAGVPKELVEDLSIEYYTKPGDLIQYLLANHEK